MTLACMINKDEDALICDLAETYHIYDYRSLPLQLVATLSAGLRDDSRIKLRFADSPVTQDTILLATIVDKIEMFKYLFTTDASKGINKPSSVVDAILNGNTKKQKGIVAYKTAEAFEAAMAKYKGD